jgi:hypothetical protein
MMLLKGEFVVTQLTNNECRVANTLPGMQQLHAEFFALAGLGEVLHNWAISVARTTP